MLATSDKRQNYRFPVFDDETGVKLIRKRNRGFLKDVLEDGFEYKTYQEHNNQMDRSNSIELDQIEMIDAPDYFGTDGLFNAKQEKAIPKQSKPVFKEKKVQIKDSRTKETNKAVYAEPKTDSYSAPQSSFSNKFYEMDDYGNAKHRKLDKKRPSFESSYHLPGEKEKTLFQPKHIPASLIEDDVEKEALKHDRVAIVDELRKASKSTLLLMETDDNGHVEENNVPRYDEKKKASNHEVAYSSKKKNQRLEKSLSGIIADEAKPNMDNYYFD